MSEEQYQRLIVLWEYTVLPTQADGYAPSCWIYYPWGNGEAEHPPHIQPLEVAG